jgi:asparagine synthase (glutamine-hydrolysing)
MCGIAGIIRFDGSQVQRRDMQNILNQIEHRGRDDFGLVGDDIQLSRKANIALGHKRLSIIDLSHDSVQPMSYSDGRLWISFNGEIYNYLELRQELMAEGYRFRTRSDTEVILASYEKWGEDCVTKLNGMFAFALWDEELGQLFCARDHLGIKPFYYFKSEKCIAFASESKALSQFHQNNINLDGLAAYLLGLYVPGSWSIFDGVAKLLPGHFMIVKPSGDFKLKRYWRINSVSDGEDNEVTRASLEGHLKTAVMRQLRSDVPVGAFLSGGVDSGMIVALASNQGIQLNTYSIGFEGQVESELPAASMIATTFNTVHRATNITARESIGILNTSLKHLSEPIADPAIVPSYLLSKMAAADGVKVVLSGTGGDEVFAGYERYVGSNLRRRVFSASPEWIREKVGSILPRSSKISARLRNTCLDMLFTTGGDFDLCAGMLGQGKKLEDFLDRLSQSFPSSVSQNCLPLLYKQLGFDLSVYLPDEILLLLDQMTMAHTIEGRVPFLDLELVESAFHFPSESHSKRGRTKILLREIASKYLGEEYVWKKKQGFAGPVPWWVRGNLQLFREVAISALEIPGMEPIAPIVFELCRHPTISAQQAHSLFILYCLKQWFDGLER